MNKRIILAGLGIVLVFILFFFGKTVTIKKQMPVATQAEVPQFNIKDTLIAEKQRLSPVQLIYVTNIENGISRGDLKNQSENQ